MLADLLPGITTPVRVIAGSDDQVVPPVNATYLAERLPSGRADLVDGAGHWVQQEQPEQVSRLLIQFLHDQAPRSARR